MLFKNWDMYMDIIMNMTVYNSAYGRVYLLNAKLCVRLKAKLEMHVEMYISNLLIFGSRSFNKFNNSCLISISSEKFEFYESKMYLDVEIVAPFMLLHNSKFNNFAEFCHFVRFLF